MDFAKSDIQGMLLDSAERLLGEHAHVEYWREQRASETGFDEARWAQFAELGWLALPLPESAGGLDGTIEDVALLNIALGRALVTEPYVSSVVLAGHILAEAADNDDAAALLQQIGSGDARVALAHREAGDDPLAVSPQALHATKSGEGYRLQGHKLMVLDAASASHLIVSAHMDDTGGIGLFLVPRETQGLEVSGYPLIDGTHAADTRFTDVAIPASALLVGGNRAEEVLGETIARASIALLGQAVGAMEAALDICGTYVKERKQFGTAIGSFQSIQHIMADMFVSAHQARSMLYYAIANAEAPATVRDAALSAARLVIGESSQQVARNGIQVHGGYGLTDEYAISHYFRRLMAIEKHYGDLTDHTTRFADSLFA